MKAKVIVSVIGMLVFVLGVAVLAQTEQPAGTSPNAQPSQQVVLQDLAVTLDQMIQNLSQEKVTPETLKSVTEQMKQLSQTIKQIAGVADRKAPKRSCCQAAPDEAKSDAKDQPKPEVQL